MEEEKKEEVVETSKKEKKQEKEKKNIFVRILDKVLWLVLIAWIGICVVDYINVVNEKEPQFCIKKETITYDDGTVDVCRGAGYVTYHYQRKSYNGYEFGPFWTKDRSNK